MNRFRGFTLVELLVSMAVVALVMVLTVQLVGKASSITSASNKFFDTSSMARIVFDRIGDDLSCAALNGGPTILYYSGSAGSAIDPKLDSSIGFVCKTRARKLSVATAIQDVRGTMVAYKIRPTSVNLRNGSKANISLINRGDAEFTFSAKGTDATPDTPGNFGFSIWDMFGISSSTSLPNDLTSPNGDSNLLVWQGFGDGVLRFHVSFVLDDGRIVQSLKQASHADPNTGATVPALDASYIGYNVPNPPPNLAVNGGTGDCVPVAFSAATTSDTNKRYVTGMIIGIVALDQTTLNISYVQTAGLPDLAGQLKRPVNDGETPLGIWQANLTGITPSPVRQNIRFYQRFYAVNP